MINHLIGLYQHFFYFKQIKIAQKKIKLNKKNIIFQISTLYHFKKLTPFLLKQAMKFLDHVAQNKFYYFMDFQ